MQVLRQILSFGAVGIAATVTHIAAAWIAFEAGGLHPLIANLIGAITAFVVSFAGNAIATFQTERAVTNSAMRYFAISLLSYVMASAIMMLVEAQEWPTFVYAVMVLATIPPTTFLLAKFWAFAPVADPGKAPSA
jgi:putative flippase GtrA